MSTASAQTTINITYNEPNQENGPPFIRAYSNSSEVIVRKNGTTEGLTTGPVPPNENGIITLVFKEDYYPLNLYYDGENMSIPVQAEDGSIALLIPFLFESEMSITVFSVSGNGAPGQAGIQIVGSSGSAEIGIVIVGTSGLSVTDN